MRRPSLSAWITATVVLVACAYVFLNLEPRLLFRNTTPSGGDMGAHVWGPQYLRDHLLPHGRLTGWSPDWYAGFPALVFYFPLPSLLIAALATLLPYGVAFKLVTVLGLVTLPAAAWAMGRLLGARDPVPACLAIATVPFLFDESFTIYGGNIASTLAGEFAFSISLSIALVFLGVFAKMLQTGRYRAWSAALLAVTALCHVVPAFFAIAGAVILLGIHASRRAVINTLWTFGVSGLIAAFWVVPFMLRIAYTNDMGWEKLTTYTQILFRDGPEWLLLLGLAGAVVSLALRRRSGLFFILLAAASALAFVLMPQGRLWNARLLPFWILSLHLLVGVAVAEGGRLLFRLFETLGTPEREPLPYAIGDEGSLDTDRLGVDPNDDFLSPPPNGEGGQDDRAPAFDLAALLVPIGALVVTLYLVSLPLGILPWWLQTNSNHRAFVPSWIEWNYTGYEGKASYPEYHGVVETMGAIGQEHGCGRAMWEYEPELDRLGTPMALMLLPHWTDGCIGSMEGLFFESSASTPYHFLNQAELSFKPSSAQRDLPYRSLASEPRDDVLAQGVRHLQLMGVRYYMAISPEVQAVARTNPDLELLTTSGPWEVNYNRVAGVTGTQLRTWEIYRVRDADLVVALDHKPAVMQGVAKGGKPWLRAAVDWYQDESRFDVPLAASGPADWPRVGKAALADAPRESVDPAVVTNIRTTDDRITFDVDEPGKPVLVKMSYFPNWQASGADGPWRVTPNLMVVVPTSTHVELHYGHTPVDGVAWGLTLVGLAGLAYLIAAGRRQTA
jgi:hypothetical protein